MLKSHSASCCSSNVSKHITIFFWIFLTSTRIVVRTQLLNSNRNNSSAYMARASRRYSEDVQMDSLLMRPSNKSLVFIMLQATRSGQQRSRRRGQLQFRRRRRRRKRRRRRGWGALSVWQRAFLDTNHLTNCNAAIFVARQVDHNLPLAEQVFRPPRLGHINSRPAHRFVVA